MNKPKPIRDLEAAGWTKLERDWCGTWTGLPPGGNGGVIGTAWTEPSVHDRNEYAFKILIALLKSKNVIAKDSVATAVSMADYLIEKLNE